MIMGPKWPYEYVIEAGYGRYIDYSFSYATVEYELSAYTRGIWVLAKVSSEF